MIWVDGLHYSPMAFLLMTAAFRSAPARIPKLPEIAAALIARVLAPKELASELVVQATM